MRCGERSITSFNGNRPGINPRMFQNTIGAEPLMCFLDEQASNQIFRVLGDASPLLIGKLVSALLNTGEQQFLTGLTIFPSAPTAVSAAVAVKGRIAAEQNIHDDTKAPEIATFVVIIGLADECLDYFRRHKLGAAHWRQKLRRCHRTRQRVELDTWSKIKVAYLDWRQLVRIHAQEVLGLEISMSDPWIRIQKKTWINILSDNLNLTH